jgi:hypothetical protein
VAAFEALNAVATTGAPALAALAIGSPWRTCAIEALAVSRRSVPPDSRASCSDL